ncbi:hypothetical protein EKN06_00505 [Croceicoccus ponticola]|uniref:Uncharacterized protein n=1 Tax=Croceicoccus ponticola TaxID=2217664 RepID=A0A437GZJ1_9SPHN|nr:hypothetical protein [Croceicoccus ponticola]RVQ68750.1 hypothetical protein EKN06_00505 [Croceicoccus ponticola]
MICPLSVDWGNAADWVAGIGSISAVGVAIWIATGQERFARHIREIEKNEAIEKRAHLQAEIIRLIAEIESVMGKAIMRQSMAAGMGMTSRADLDEVEALRLQLQSMQSLAESDPKLYGEIGRAFRESNITEIRSTSSSDFIGLTLESIRRRLKDRRSAIASL